MEIDQADSQSTQKKSTEIHFGHSSSQKVFTEKMSLTAGQRLKSKDADIQMKETVIKPATMFIPRQVQQKSFAKILTNNKIGEKSVLESGNLSDLDKTLSILKDT